MFQTMQVIKTQRTFCKPSEVDQEWQTKQQRKDKRNKPNRKTGRNNKRNWEM
ncbi:hypothetical protein VPIG_00068 [Vibrio phage PWH3a-P1]|uniref:hypothetical protein n=1 Tax=Vibrio phage PWH3a-P1 TaxID=754058 RepID=UPI0002C0FFDD|nr:hypothetical protein VPIG_00068 [Vibrio phage PWH3a-P1]AGH31926.1 hypothetical protein VPIG_00068 [Vibrio phage PWH3a-P1]